MYNDTPPRDTLTRTPLLLNMQRQNSMPRTRIPDLRLKRMNSSWTADFRSAVIGGFLERAVGECYRVRGGALRLQEVCTFEEFLGCPCNTHVFGILGGYDEGVGEVRGIGVCYGVDGDVCVCCCISRVR